MLKVFAKIQGETLSNRINRIIGLVPLNEESLSISVMSLVLHPHLVMMHMYSKFVVDTLSTF